jgi:hypothetical protein
VDSLKGIQTSIDRVETRMPKGWGIGFYTVRPRPDVLLQGVKMNPGRLWFAFSAANIAGMWRLSGARMESVDSVGVAAEPSFMVEAQTFDACLDLVLERLQPI